jgi:hypothetical protein
MTIRYGTESAAFFGHVSVDDADGLAQWLRQQATPAIDLGQCEQVHGAVLQVVLALRPGIAVAPPDPQLRAALAHLLQPTA